MVLFLAILLYVSLVCMVALVAVKRWELQTGNIVGARIRPAITHVLHSFVYWSKETFPVFVRERFWHTITIVVRDISRHALANGILWVEHTLERTLHAIRQNTAPPPHHEGAASEFLREVTEHKKMLARRSRRYTPPAEE